MEMTLDHVNTRAWNALAAYVALAATAVSCAALIGLHVLSPEFSPSWRMVSEYANGAWSWVLTLVFIGWAVSSFALVIALWPLRTTTLGRVGLSLLVVAGVGQTMGALFDINHKLHGAAAMIGIPTLCVAAVLVTMAMTRRPGVDSPPKWSAHFPWVSFGLMLTALIMLMAALKAAGVDLSAQTGPLKALPAGVSGYVGWANRLFFASAYLWVALASLCVIWARRLPNSGEDARDTRRH